MAKVTAKIGVPYATSVAEALFYDTSRWPGFIDGFGHLQKVEGQWPQPGARAIWDSPPQGRGRVIEQVTAYEPRVSCTADVEDDKLRGAQTVTFTPREDGTTIALTLQYALKPGTAFAPVVDLLFIRRAQRDSLTRTLRRFALELRDEVSPPV